ncbi:type I-E CRISPR-associated protein Cas5/CasD [Derxia gummosa]|uniref:Type I-E CRISPR-associated protein Cas5/CasD n=1 Tax=Derxia gummosa DSM 723 TaxID=1121388 RepID=A0A8B6XDK6_9BURK|nr:type I-E CRISPR-associated protein Cas5/CasD [Derxia gummosa]
MFQLRAPLASWGEPAVGEYRGTAEHPSQSALVGLLGAALGIDRADEAGHAALRDGFAFAVAVLGEPGAHRGAARAGGSLLRDYHTAQVPPRAALKGWPHRSRRDELAIPKRDLTTILSTRDYRQNASWLVAVQAFAGARWPLAGLAEALRRPRFVLCLGRRSCPPSAPLWPQVIDAASALSAFEDYRARQVAAIAAADAARAADERRSRGLPADAASARRQWRHAAPADDALGPVARLAWADGAEPGIDPAVTSVVTTVRKDRVIRRQGWLFGDRAEHVAILDPES